MKIGKAVTNAYAYYQNYTIIIKNIIKNIHTFL